MACVALASIPGCQGGTPAQPPPKNALPNRTGFQFQTGDKLRVRIEATFEIQERALGVENDELYLRGKESAHFEITIVDAAASLARIAPVSFEFQWGHKSYSFKDGAISKSPEAEESEMWMPTAPFEVTLKDDGLVDGTSSDQFRGIWLLTGPLFSHPSALPGWLGPLPDSPVREGLEWSHDRLVMLAREDFMPVIVTTKGLRRTRDGWSAPFTVLVDRKSDRYPWLKTCVESGAGTLDLDERGRPVKATVNWKATTPDSKPIGDYRWSCEFTR